MGKSRFERRRAHRNLRILALAVVLGAGGAACTTTIDPPKDAGVTDGGFDDHTLSRLQVRADFDRLAAAGPGLSSVKVAIAAFSDPSLRAAAYFDSAVYTLHDEWYWFRLMNGERMVGDDVEPVRGFHFATVGLITAYARDLSRQQKKLPLDLAFVGPDLERLYSPRFYHEALSVRPPRYGLATLLMVSARTQPVVRPELWAFELEYTHRPTHDEIRTFFQMLIATTPAEIGGQLKWVVRSPEQEALAQQMAAQHLEYWDRVIRYSDLVVPGDAEVYSEGITAGRMRAIEPGASLDVARPEDILVLSAPPDFLPICSGLLTGVPQTPLAHVNVLARNRGIPNAYLAGLTEDPQIDQLARVNAPAIVRAEAPNKVDVLAITEEQYRTYRALGARPPKSVPPIDLTGVPATYDLATLSVRDMDRLRPLLGGKSAGFIALLSEPGLDHPDQPLAITIAPFVKHMEGLRPALEEMLAKPEFQNNAKVRFLVLEGPADFGVRYPAAADLTFRDQFLVGRPQGDVLGDFARAGGLKAVIRSRPVDAATLAEITQALRQHFGSFAVTQGIRFRSSSNVEDIEGFNGAGLYDSNTGYLDAEQLPDPLEAKKTVAFALRKTWASYWGFEAFEERSLERVDHLSGSMGILAHARFDDDKELSNGVFTLTILPPELDSAAILEVNVQKGALSVTNPPPGSNALPEVDRLILARGASVPQITRVRASTLLPAGQVLLDDAQLLSLFEHAEAITQRWLDDVNSRLSPRQRSRTLTLDFELRHTEAGWPALSQGTPYPRRVVVKQARPLEPGVRANDGLGAYPFPRDLRARARKVERRSCTSTSVSLWALELYTDPLLSPDLGHSQAPFTGQLSLHLTADLPALGLTRGATLTLDHLSFTTEHPGMATGGPWSIVTRLSPAAATTHGIDAIAVDAGGQVRLTRGAAEVVEAGTCERQSLFASPKDFLLDLLEQARTPSGG